MPTFCNFYANFITFPSFSLLFIHFSIILKANFSFKLEEIKTANFFFLNTENTSKTEMLAFASGFFGKKINQDSACAET